jgi:hypothetical protein
MPESLDELLPADQLARTLGNVTARRDLSEFEEAIDSIEGAAGRPAFSPEMLLTAWL